MLQRVSRFTFIFLWKKSKNRQPACTVRVYSFLTHTIQHIFTLRLSLFYTCISFASYWRLLFHHPLLLVWLSGLAYWGFLPHRRILNTHCICFNHYYWYWLLYVALYYTLRKTLARYLLITLQKPVCVVGLHVRANPKALVLWPAAVTLFWDGRKTLSNEVALRFSIFSTQLNGRETCDHNNDDEWAKNCYFAKNVLH